MAGRTGKLFGKAKAFQQRRGDTKKPHPHPPNDTTLDIKTPEQVVFEGMRATAKDGIPKDLKFGKKKGKAKAGKPTHRGAKRASAWKKQKS